MRNLTRSVSLRLRSAPSLDFSSKVDRSVQWNRSVSPFDASPLQRTLLGLQSNPRALKNFHNCLSFLASLKRGFVGHIDQLFSHYFGDSLEISGLRSAQELAELLRSAGFQVSVDGRLARPSGNIDPETLEDLFSSSLGTSAPNWEEEEEEEEAGEQPVGEGGSSNSADSDDRTREQHQRHPKSHKRQTSESRMMDDAAEILTFFSSQKPSETENSPSSPRFELTPPQPPPSTSPSYDDSTTMKLELSSSDGGSGQMVNEQESRSSDSGSNLAEDNKSFVHFCPHTQWYFRVSFVKIPKSESSDEPQSEVAPDIKSIDGCEDCSRQFFNLEKFDRKILRWEVCEEPPPGDEQYKGNDQTSSSGSSVTEENSSDPHSFDKIHSRKKRGWQMQEEEKTGARHHYEGGGEDIVHSSHHHHHPKRRRSEAITTDFEDFEENGGGGNDPEWAASSEHIGGGGSASPEGAPSYSSSSSSTTSSNFYTHVSHASTAAAGGDGATSAATFATGCVLEPGFVVPKLSSEQRALRIQRYREKKERRTFTKKLRYDVRKKLADCRPRIHGRFATKEAVIAAGTHQTTAVGVPTNSRRSRTPPSPMTTPSSVPFGGLKLPDLGGNPAPAPAPPPQPTPTPNHFRATAPSADHMIRLPAFGHPTSAAGFSLTSQNHHQHQVFLPHFQSILSAMQPPPSQKINK